MIFINHVTVFLVCMIFAYIELYAVILILPIQNVKLDSYTEILIKTCMQKLNELFREAQ